jgi:hypothetical protein
MSRRKSEYIAMSDVVEEIRIVCFLLKGMAVDLKLTIFVRCDNVNSIFHA